MTLYSQKRAFFLDNFIEIIRDELNCLKIFVRGSGRNLSDSELKRFRNSFESVEYLSAACGLTEISGAALLGHYFEHEIRSTQSYLSEQVGSMLGIVINKVEEMLTRQWLSRQPAMELVDRGDLYDILLYFRKKYPEISLKKARKVSFSKDGDNFGVDLPTSIFSQIDDQKFFSMVLIDYALYEENYRTIVDLIQELANEEALILHGPIDVEDDHVISRNAGLPYYLVLKSPILAVDFLKKRGINSILLKAFGMPRGYQKIPGQKKLSIREQLSTQPSVPANENLSSGESHSSSVSVGLVPAVASSANYQSGPQPVLSEGALDEFRVTLNSSVKDTVKNEIEKLINKSNDELQQRINSTMRQELDMYVESTRKKSRRERKLEKTGGRKVPISIATKIIFIVSTILVLSIVSVAAISSIRFSASLRGSTEEVNRSNSSEISSIMTQNLLTKIQNVKSLRMSELRQLNENTNSIVNDDLNFFFTNNKDVLNFTLLDQDISFSNKSKMSAFDLTDELLQDVIEQNRNMIETVRVDANKIQVINISSSLNLNKSFLIISYPYRIGIELVPLVIFLDISDTLMPLVYVDPKITQKSIYIINRDGDVLAHSNEEYVLNAQNFRDDNEIVNKMVEDASKKDSASLDILTKTFTDNEGISWIASAAPSSFANLGVVVQIPESEALKVVSEIIRLIILITLIIVSISILFIQFFSNSIVDPLRRLVGASKKIEDGDYNVKLKRRSNDEVGVLTESFIDMAQGLAERERLKESFGKFVNKDLAEMAMKGEIKLGGEIKKASIFFSDIRAFTAISEKLEPDEVVEFLNEYMTRMVSCVSDTNGNVDKYIGDAIMAVWGTPISTDKDTENSVNGALMMRRSLMEFNQGRGGDRKPIIKIGCGINTGDVLAGQIGSSDKMEYTVIGDAVNLASRIEALNKPMGTDILISSSTYEEVKHIFDIVPMNKIKVKGKTEPQQIYAVLGRLDDPSRPRSLQHLRSMVNIIGNFDNTSSVDLNVSEEKFEILE